MNHNRPDKINACKAEQKSSFYAREQREYKQSLGSKNNGKNLTYIAAITFTPQRLFLLPLLPPEHKIVIFSPFYKHEKETNSYLSLENSILCNWGEKTLFYECIKCTLLLSAGQINRFFDPPVAKKIVRNTEKTFIFPSCTIQYFFYQRVIKCILLSPVGQTSPFFNLPVEKNRVQHTIPVLHMTFFSTWGSKNGFICPTGSKKIHFLTRL